MSFRVLVFGREPVPGQVKTRLAGDLGDEAAAQVYEVLLANTLEVAVASGADVELWLAEAPSSEFNAVPAVPTVVQTGSNLGDRMADAFARSFAQGLERVVLIGSDCPQIATRHIRQANRALQDHAVVVGPAVDGGYWLVAQRSPGTDIFRNVPWSHEDTLAAARSRLQDLGVGWWELEELNDLDTRDDLRDILADPRTSADLIRWLSAAARTSEL